MTVLAYEVHANLADHHAFLEKLKDFCNSQGWTVDDFQSSVQWAWDGAKYDWLAGSESFLEVTSTGYGAQVLNFRFRTEATGADADSEWLQMGAQLGEAINTALSTHPVEQDDWNLYRYTSFNPTTLPTVWFFGLDAKFVLAVVKFSADYCNFLTFGSPELFDTADDEGNWAGYSFSGLSKWYNKNDFIPFDVDSNNIWYDANRVVTARQAINTTFTTANNFGGEFAKYGRMITRNDYSEVRPVIKPLVYIKHVADDLWRRLGTFPIFRIDHRGLKIGEKVTYGSEEYLTFPMNRGNDERYKGLAVRIL